MASGFCPGPLCVLGVCGLARVAQHLRFPRSRRLSTKNVPPSLASLHQIPGFQRADLQTPRSDKPDVGIWCAPSPAWRPQTIQSVGFKACDAGRAFSPNRADFRRPASHSLNTSTRAQRGQNTARTSSQEPPNKRKQPPPSIKAKQRLSTITAPGDATWQRTAPTSPARLSGERGRAPRRAGVIPSVGVVARFLRVWPPVPLGVHRCVR